VLPFTNLSDDPEQQYFADGVTEGRRIPGDFSIALAAMALAYLVVIELGKRAFYGAIPAQSAPDRRGLGDGRRHLRRRAAHLGHAQAGSADSPWPRRRSPRTEGAGADGGRAVPPIPPSLGPVGADRQFAASSGTLAPAHADA